MGRGGRWGTVLSFNEKEEEDYVPTPGRKTGKRMTLKEKRKGKLMQGI